MAVRRSHVLLIAAAAVILAIAVEWSRYRQGDDRSLVLADGAVGLVLLVSAVVAWDRRRVSLVAPLIGLAGLTWFAGTAWSGAVFLHRGPLVHLLISYPTGRLRWRPARATVAVAYVAAAIE